MVWKLVLLLIVCFVLMMIYLHWNEDFQPVWRKLVGIEKKGD